MANAIPIRVAGNGTSTLSYVLPGNMMQFVQSVNAVIDNTAGGDAKPLLSVLDSSNEVIADVEQGRSIPAGDSGRATWALRLADETTTTPGGAGDVSLLWEYVVPAGGQVTVDTNVDGPMAGLLPQTFHVLDVCALTRADDLSAPHGATIRMNGDATAGHYDSAVTLIHGAPATTTVPSIQFGSGWAGWLMPAANATAGRAASMVLTIPDYASTLLHKAGTMQNFCPGGSGNAGNDTILEQSASNWHPPGGPVGINRLTFICSSLANFVEGSFFAVYGRR